MTADVTVVVPTRNRRPLLERTLRSVLAQRGVGIEVVVVDEASEDTTQEFLAELTSADERVSVVRNDQALGVAAARNAGLQLARADWTAFVDDDDLWAPTKLAAQLAALDRAGAWSCTSAVVVDENLRILGVEAAPPPDVLTRLLRRNVVPGGGSSVVAPTELLRTLAGFDERLRVLADWEMWIRLARAAPLAPLDELLVAYRRHRGGMSRDLSALDSELEHVQSRHSSLFEHRTLDWEGWHQWGAEMGRRSGRRLDPARVYAARLRRQRRPRDAARLLLALSWPGLTVLRERWEARRIPPPLRAEAEAWLSAFRREPS